MTPVVAAAIRGRSGRYTTEAKFIYPLVFDVPVGQQDPIAQMFNTGKTGPPLAEESMTIR